MDENQNQDQLVTLSEPSAPPAPLIDLGPNTGPQPVSQQSAAIRASHAHFGLQRVLPDLEYGDYYEPIRAGDEDNLRKRVASTLNAKLDQRAFDAFSNQAAAGPVTQQDYQGFRDSFRPIAPSAVFEEAFGREYMDTMYKLYHIPRQNANGVVEEQENWFSKVAKDNIVFGSKVTEISSELAAENKLLLDRIGKAQDEIEQQSYGRRALEFFKPWVPGYTDVQMRGNVPGVSVASGVFTGENMENQRIAWSRLPSLEAKAKALDDLNLTPQMKVQFMSALLGQSTSDKLLNDAFGIIDATAMASLGKGMINAVKNYKRFVDVNKQVVKNSVRDVGEKSVEQAAANSVGDINEAAKQGLILSETKAFSGVGDPAKEAVEAITPILNPVADAAKANPGNWGLAAVTKFWEQKDTALTNFVNRVRDVIKVNRIPAPLAIKAVIGEYIDNQRNIYKSFADQIVSTSPGVIYNPLTNNHGFFYYFGNWEGNSFESAEVAARYAIDVMGFKDASIVPHQIDGFGRTEVIPNGVGYLIKKYQPVNETHNIIRDALIKTSATETKYSWLNSWVSWLRTPEETLSLAERENRGLAEFVPQSLIKQAQEDVRDIHKLARKNLSTKEWKQWERAVKHSQAELDPNTKLQGYFFTPGELDNYYNNTFGRLPTEHEYKAYYSLQQALDHDWILRNLRVHANMARVGTESHRFFFTPKTGQEGVAYSPWFNGVRRAGLPGGTDGILVVDGKGGIKVYRGGTREWDGIKKKMEEEGDIHNVIEVYDPDLRELKDFAPDNRIRYVVSPGMETRGLPILNVPRRGGGHFEYDYDWWIKQAKVTRDVIGDSVKHIYTGDTTIMPITIRRMGQDVVRHMENVRLLLKDGKFDEAKAYNDANLHIDWDTHHGWYKPSKDPKGFTVGPHLDLNEPIQLVQKGKLSKTENYAAKYENYEDGSVKGSLARANQVAFTGERDAHDLFTLVDKGKKGNPLYNWQPAEVIDPVTSLNRSLSKMVSSFMMDDYKAFAIEHWVEGAKQYLRSEFKGDLRYSPFKHFYNPDYEPNADKEIIRQLNWNNYKIRQFLGVQDVTQTFMTSVKQKLIDDIYGRFGPGIITNWLLPNIKDPFQYARAMAFHEKLGLFNYAQMFKQMSTAVNVLGMAGPKMFIPGSAATFFHQLVRMNVKSIDHFDTLLSRLRIPGYDSFGWKPGWYKESHEAVERTGFLDGVHSHIDLDAPLSNEVIRSRWGSVLNAGSWFFREGANNTKIASWHTAFLEWRIKNPTKTLGDQDIREIFTTARTYNHNMDRSSASMLQGGLGSLPLQFQSYIYRLAELMTGSRLTPIQKVRFFVTAGAMYGFPLAVGLYGTPFDDFFRPMVQKEGYVPGRNFINTTFMEGLPAAVLGSITGKYYDINKQFGPKGYDAINQMVRTDGSILSIILGAGGSTVSDTMALSDPFWFWLSNAFKGATGLGEDRIPGFQVKPEHLFNAAKVITSVNNSWRLIAALLTGKWMSRNDTYLSNTTWYDSLFMATFGLQPTEVTDLAGLEDIGKERKEFDKRVEHLFKLELAKALTALHSNDYEQHAEYVRNSYALLKFYPVEKRNKLIAEAANTHRTLVDRVRDDSYLKGAEGRYPPEQMQVLRDTWRYIRGQQ